MQSGEWLYGVGSTGGGMEGGATGQSPAKPADAGRLRRGWRRAGEALERLLHAPLRRAAMLRLRGSECPPTVLFVCTGNLYRSPYAAGLFARSLPERLRAGVEVRSAGFVTADRPCPPAALELAARRGVDLSSHRSEPLTSATVAAAGMIVVMDPMHAEMIRQRFVRRSSQRVVVLGDLDPAAAQTRAIADPWDAPEGTLEESYARIERCVDALLEALAPDG